MHQFALDGGNWRIAWELALLPDPFGGAAFGGSEEELTIIAAYKKSHADLQDRTRIQFPARNTDVAEEEGEGEGSDVKPAPKRKGKR